MNIELKESLKRTWEGLKSRGLFPTYSSYEEWEKRKESKLIPTKLPKESYQNWFDKLPLEVKNRLKKP